MSSWSLQPERRETLVVRGITNSGPFDNVNFYDNYGDIVIVYRVFISNGLLPKLRVGKSYPRLNTLFSKRPRYENVLVNFL